MQFRFTFKAALCAATAISGLSTLAHAADASADMAEEILVTGLHAETNLNQVSSASRLGLTIFETPASVESIDGDVIRARGDLTIQEAISRATGISFVGSPGNGNTALTSRGFSGQGSIQMLVDGTRLYVASGTLTFPVDPWTVERIDVLRGPNSVMFGEGAIGGSINVIMKKPTPDAQIYNAQIGYGSNDSIRAAADLGGPLGGGFSYRVAGSYSYSNGWLDRNSDNRNFAVSGALRFDAAPNLSFNLASDYGDVKILPYFGTPLVNGEYDARFRRINFNIDDPQNHFRDSWTRFNIDWQPSEAVSIRNTAYYLQSDRDYTNAETYRFVPATGRVTRSDYLNIIHDQHQYGDRADVSIRTPIGSMENTLLVGFDVNRIKFQHTNNSPYGGTSSVDPFDFDPGSFLTPVATTPGFRSLTTQYSIFAEDQLKLTDWFSLVGGFRRDWFDFERIDLRVAANSFSRKFRSTNWRVGTVVNPTPDTALYASYTTGADPLGALITTSNAQKSFGLSPAKQIEIGVKQRFLDDRGAISIALFDIQKRRLLTTDPLNRLVTQQVGKRSSKGIEASLAFQLSDAFGIEANGTILKARFDDFDETVTVSCPSGPVPGTSTPIPPCPAGQPAMPVVVSRAGNTAPGVPTRTGNISANWSIIDALQARVTARFVSGRWIDNANTLRIPAYEVVDLGLRWRISDRMALDGRVSNVFDKVYAVSGGAAQWLLGTPRRYDLRLDISM
jgi:iron complex outermembrane receptor protein